MPMTLPPALPLNTDFAGLLDGNFDFWDTGTSFAITASDEYCSDMWIANAGTGGSATVSQNIPTVGSEPQWITRPRQYRTEFQQTVGASTNPMFGQKLENVYQYAGEIVCLSGTLSASSAGNWVVGIQAIQNFGSGGSASVVTQQLNAWQIGTNENFFFTSITIPSIAGKTIGTGSYIRFDLLLSTGATFTLTLSQLQIDRSSLLPFRYRGIALEYQRIIRRIWTYNAPSLSAFANGFAANATNAFAWDMLPVQMATTPAVSVIAGGFSCLVVGAGTFTAVSFMANSRQSFQCSATISGGTASQSAYFQGANGTGGTLAFDARL